MPSALQSFLLPDNVTRLVVSDAQAAALDEDSNGLGDSIDIERRFRPEDVGEEVFTSVEFKARRNGVEDLPAFRFDKPATVILRYSTTTAGAPAPMGVASAGARAAALEEHYVKVGREADSERERLRGEREAWEAGRLAESRALSQRQQELAAQTENLAAEYQRKRSELQRVKETMQSELARVVQEYQAKKGPAGGRP